MSILTKDEKYVQKCLSGELLFGDDFSIEDIIQWFSIEEQAYVKLYFNTVNDNSINSYADHEINKYHGFSNLPPKVFEKVLSIGGGFCYELAPIYDCIGEIVVIEPGDKFIHEKLLEKDLKYIKPDVSGKILFESETFDLITCFNTLHHIPNVSFVISEISRVLKPNGYLLVNEPITSMGDWFKTRTGLTSLERGIPKKLMQKFFNNANLELIKAHFCLFAPLRALMSKFNNVSYNNTLVTKLDFFLATIFSFNQRYYAQNAFDKIRPGNCFYVVTKRSI